MLSDFRFLRQQHTYLTKLQAAKVEPELGPSQNADIHDVPIEKERNCFSSELLTLLKTPTYSFTYEEK